jgi:hypothetical protein
MDLNIRLFVRGKLTATDRKALEETDYTAVTNNFFQFLFSERSLTLNGTTITQTTDVHQYRSYLETLLTYGSDAANSHLTNEFWYLDTGNYLPCDPTKAESRNILFIARWTLIKQSKEVQLLGRLHIDNCNIIPYLIPGVKL